MMKTHTYKKKEFLEALAYTAEGADFFWKKYTAWSAYGENALEKNLELMKIEFQSVAQRGYFLDL